jgi:hypothetical protein
MSEMLFNQENFKSKKVGRPYSSGFEDEQDRLGSVILWIELHNAPVLPPEVPFTQQEHCDWEGMELRTFQNYLRKFEKKGSPKKKRIL